MLGGFVCVRECVRVCDALCVCVCSQAEAKPPEEAFHPTVKRSGWQPPKDTGLWAIADSLHEEVCVCM